MKRIEHNDVYHKIHEIIAMNTEFHSANGDSIIGLYGETIHKIDYGRQKGHTSAAIHLLREFNYDEFQMVTPTHITKNHAMSLYNARFNDYTERIMTVREFERRSRGKKPSTDNRISVVIIDNSGVTSVEYDQALMALSVRNKIHSVIILQ